MKLHMKLGPYVDQQIDGTTQFLHEHLYPFDKGQTRMVKACLRMLVSACLNHQLAIMTNAVTEDDDEEQYPSPVDVSSFHKGG